MLNSQQERTDICLVLCIESPLSNNAPFLELGHHHHRAEGLLFSDEHVVLNAREHRGLHEEPWNHRDILYIFKFIE